MSRLLMIFLLLPVFAAAQIIPISQNRTVACSAGASDNSGGGGSDDQFDQAGDFDLFETNVYAEWFGGLAFGAAEATQESSILGSSLMMLGDAVATVQTLSPDWTGEGDASSVFEVEFQVAEDFAFNLTGTIYTQNDGFLDIEIRNGDGAVVFSIYESNQGIREVADTGNLAAGTYTVDITVHVDIETTIPNVPVTGFGAFDLELGITTEAIGVGDTFTQDRFLTVGPNPLQGSTQIAYASDRAPSVTLDVLDVRGRRVRELITSSPASGQLVWDGRDDRGQPVPQGIYFVRMLARDDLLMRKVSVVR